MTTERRSNELQWYLAALLATAYLVAWLALDSELAEPSARVEATGPVPEPVGPGPSVQDSAQPRRVRVQAGRVRTRSS